MADLPLSIVIHAKLELRDFGWRIITNKFCKYTASRLKFYLTSFPKGTSAKPANFICCLAKGIPIIVIANTIAQKRWCKASNNPKVSIQKMFMIVAIHPVPFSFVTISFPNGHKLSCANLIAWIPKGMPIIVMQSARPETTYWIPLLSC